MTNRQSLHFGIKTTQYFPYADILRVWQEADALPLIEHAWLFDHPMPIGRRDPSGPCLDGWTTLAALAAQTQRLRLGLMVASNANQTPPLLAKRAATLDIISQGRLQFGLGAGGAVEREHTAYGIATVSAGESVRRLGEACAILKGMWTEPVFNFAGRYYQIEEAYCEPKPVQKPTPPFVLGGMGEQLTLRIVAQYADVWNFPGVPGLPHGSLETFQQKSRVLDQHCEAIGRDPASIMRSVQIIIDPSEPTTATRETIRQFIAAGATHFVLAPHMLGGGSARWLSDEIIQPVCEAVGDE